MAVAPCRLVRRAPLRTSEVCRHRPPAQGRLQASSRVPGNGRTEFQLSVTQTIVTCSGGSPDRSLAIYGSPPVSAGLAPPLSDSEISWNAMPKDFPPRLRHPATELPAATWLFTKFVRSGLRKTARWGTKASCSLFHGGLYNSNSSRGT